MQIRRLYVRNFRSFREIDLTLPDFSVLIGANASGKTNFVQLFRFLRDVAREGFENAIALQGGVEYLRNFKLGASEPLEICVGISVEGSAMVAPPAFPPHRVAHLFEYQVMIKFSERGRRYRVVQEKLTAQDRAHPPDAPVLSDITVTRRSETEVQVQGLPVWRHPRPASKQPREVDSYVEPLAGRDTSILQAFYGRLPSIIDWFQSISLFDFDVKSLKKPAPLESRPQLAEDGSNLAAIVRRLASNQEQRRRLQLHLSRFLPFIADVRTQATMEKAVAYQVQETYSPRLLPSQLLSDGTAEALAFIVALYFTPSSVTIIEEPDRNLHPALIERLVNACSEVSQEKPVIITTHNPEVVRYAPLESLLLVERDADGFSVIKKPSDSVMVQEFLKHELMPSELFVGGALGV